MSKCEFTELGEPVNTTHGWFVSTASHLPFQYLHSDLELHEATGSMTTNVYPGYFATLEEAEKTRDLYYAKHNTPVIKKYNEKAWDRAMEGLR